MNISAVLTGILLTLPPVLVDPVDLLPLLTSQPAEADWNWAEKPVVYGPETLFEYLNGGAPQYLSYGFVKLVHARYAFRGDDLNSVTVDVFDMGSRLGAFGIYSAGKPREISLRPWGTEGYRSGFVAAAWKGRIYIHGVADEETPELVGKLERVIGYVLSNYDGEKGWPVELERLPGRGLLSNTARFVGKSLLGLAFLHGGFLAEYENGDSESTLFLSSLESPAKAAEAFRLLRSFEIERGEVTGTCELGEACFAAEDAGLGRGVVFLRGSSVGGMWRIQNYQEAIRVLQDLDRTLSAGAGAQQSGSNP